jgi:MoaA/NifB/PqqE/SkfB family radical SAM enzyme
VGNPYATDKILWHPDRLAAMRAGERPVPVSLQLIISDYCNQDCHWCAYRASGGLSVEQFAGPDKTGAISRNPLRMIPPEKVREIVNDAAAMGVKSITWTGGGEPTVHPQHIELFDHALDLGLECSLNTNGVIFRKGWEDVLPRFAYARFSIDAGTPEEYARIRRTPPAMYHTALEHMASLVRAIEEQHTGCVVGAGYVVEPTNIENVMQGVARIRDTGAAYVRLASMQSIEGESVYGDRLQDAIEVCREASSDLSTPDFKVVNLFEGSLGQRMDDPYCGFQEIVVYVGGNQKVYRCCYTAFTAMGEVGDLTRQRFSDWWASDEAAQLYRDFDARTCITCPMVEKNAVITNLVKTTPLHANFI